MKRYVVALFASTLVALACAPSAKAPTAVASDSGTYVCPMHPEVTSPAPGTCSKCGMKLVRH